MFVSSRLAYSRIGRAWMAIREDEVAAAAMGVNCSAMKLLAFMIGAGFAGMTGTFYVAKLQTATPEMFGFPVSTMILVMVVFGGIGSVTGVVLGAVILSLLQSWWLPDLSDWLHAAGRTFDSAWLQQVDLAAATELIFGILLVVMMLYRREGLIPATSPRRARSRDGSHHAMAAPRLDPAIGPAIHASSQARVALEVKNLSVRFDGLLALNAVNLTVPPHTLIALVGPNGSGKSTLFNAITGLTPVATGTIDLNREPIAGLPPHHILARGIARTFQNIRLFPNLSVMDNVLIGQHARLTSGPVAAIFRPPATQAEEREARDIVVAILSMFGDRLVPVLDLPVSRLSYANRRRVEIARALASRPCVLLLDEPAAGMNPAETLELAAQIETLRRLPLTILLIEHKFDLVTKLADHVIVLHHGEVIAEGRPPELRTDPRVQSAYLGYAA
jgi:branched-chain amino acid transport system permease protein